MTDSLTPAPMPQQFRKKPVVIDAIQWTGSNLPAVIKFIDGAVDTRSTHWDDYQEIVRKNGLTIHTLEDGPDGRAKHVASEGDWIIRGVKGEFYPCKPDIFAATYEPVEPPVTVAAVVAPAAS